MVNLLGFVNCYQMFVVLSKSSKIQVLVHKFRQTRCVEDCTMSGGPKRGRCTEDIPYVAPNVAEDSSTIFISMF